MGPSVSFPLPLRIVQKLPIIVIPRNNCKVTDTVTDFIILS